MEVAGKTVLQWETLCLGPSSRVIQLGAMVG